MTTDQLMGFTALFCVVLCLYYLTSHQLMDFIRCPRLYYLKKTSLT